MHRSIMLLTLLSLAYNPDVSAQLSPTDQSLVENEVRAQFVELTRAADEVNPDLFGDMFSSSPDASLFFGGMAFSADSAKRLVRTLYSNLSRQALNMHDTKVFPIDRNHALLTSVGSFTETSKAGLTSAPRRVVVSVLWVRESGTWKYLHFHESIAPGT